LDTSRNSIALIASASPIAPSTLAARLLRRAHFTVNPITCSTKVQAAQPVAS
jgi:hypothetical protein